MDDEGRFQVGVGAIIARGDKLLLIYRAATEVGGKKWEFPYGRIKQFESLQDGLTREVIEETGITDLVIGDPVAVFSIKRGGDTAEHEVRGVTFACTSEQAEVALSFEHDGYEWATMDKALELIVNPSIRADLLAYKRLVYDVQPQSNPA